MTHQNDLFGEKHGAAAPKEEKTAASKKPDSNASASLKNDEPAAVMNIPMTGRESKVMRAIGDTTLSETQIAILKNTVAKNTSDTELAYFLNVCRSAALNPFLHEIWCYKDYKGDLIVFSGRDGFLSKAQQSALFGGIRSCEVCDGDVFEMDIPNAKITHTFKAGKRGEVLGAYAIVFRKGGEPTIEYADFASYNRKVGAWNTHKAAMIKKVAETNALKKCFGISGIQSEYDWEVRRGVVQPIKHTMSEIDTLKEQVIEALDQYQGDDRDELQQMCADKQAAGEFTKAFATEILKQLSHGTTD